MTKQKLNIHDSNTSETVAPSASDKSCRVQFDWKFENVSLDRPACPEQTGRKPKSMRQANLVQRSTTTERMFTDESWREFAAVFIEIINAKPAQWRREFLRGLIACGVAQEMIEIVNLAIQRGDPEAFARIPMALQVVRWLATEKVRH
jgi:hypothetical protein